MGRNERVGDEVHVLWVLVSQLLGVFMEFNAATLNIKQPQKCLRSENLAYVDYIDKSLNFSTMGDILGI